MEGSLRANRGEQGVSLGKHGCGGRDRRHRGRRDQSSGSLWGPSGLQCGRMRKRIRCGRLSEVEGEGFVLKLDVTGGRRWALEKVLEPAQAENVKGNPGEGVSSSLGG